MSLVCVLSSTPVISSFSTSIRLMHKHSVLELFITTGVVNNIYLLLFFTSSFYVMYIMKIISPPHACIFRGERLLFTCSTVLPNLIHGLWDIKFALGQTPSEQMTGSRLIHSPPTWFHYRATSVSLIRQLCLVLRKSECRKILPV